MPPSYLPIILPTGSISLPGWQPDWEHGMTWYGVCYEHQPVLRHWPLKSVVVVVVVVVVHGGHFATKRCLGNAPALLWASKRSSSSRIIQGTFEPVFSKVCGFRKSWDLCRAEKTIAATLASRKLVSCTSNLKLFKILMTECSAKRQTETNVCNEQM